MSLILKMLIKWYNNNTVLIALVASFIRINSHVFKVVAHLLNVQYNIYVYIKINHWTINYDDHAFYINAIPK